MKRRSAAAALLAGVILMLGAPAVSAHPLGNFTVNAGSFLALSPGRASVHYVLDMAEVPTVQEMPRIDTNSDGTADDAERAAWAESEVSIVRDGISLETAGHPVPLQAGPATMELLPGQAGLQILRFEVTFVGKVPASGSLTYHDANFADRTGWREITLTAQDVAVSGVDVPVQSTSDELRSYPVDALQSPVRVTSTTLSFETSKGASREPSTETQANAPGAAGTVSDARTARPGTDTSGFAGLLSGSGFSVLALLLAVGFGAAHALAPGHGKTLVAAYLVGSGAKMRQAALAGGAVALMHTASVLALGMVVLFAQRLFAPERVYPWLGVASGVVVLVLAGRLLRDRLRSPVASPGEHTSHGHDHGDHESREGGHPHDHGHGHTHPAPDPSVPLMSRKGLVALALSGGMLPSPTALVVLLGSIALHRVGFGLGLIAAFSIGLAGALVLVGVLAVRARDAFASRFGSRLGRAIPVAGAAVMLIAGAVLLWRGAAQL